MTNTKAKGIYFALAAALISGISIFVNKLAITAIKEPLVFTVLKNSGVAIIIMMFLLSSGNLRKVTKLGKRELVYLVLIGIIGGSIPFYLFFKGLSMIPAINGAIIQKTLVLWVGILAVPYLKEKMSKIGWLTVLVLFGANILVGGFKGFQFSVGEYYVLASTIFWAIETVVSKKILTKVDPDIVVEARMGIGALILLAFAVFLKPHALVGVANLSLDNWLWIFLTAGLLTAYVATWYRGLKYAPATLGTAVLVGSTLVTNILSAIFVTHTLNALLIMQSLLISLGILVLYKVEVRTSAFSNPGLDVS